MFDQFLFQSCNRGHIILLLMIVNHCIAIYPNQRIPQLLSPLIYLYSGSIKASISRSQTMIAPIPVNGQQLHGLYERYMLKVIKLIKPELVFLSYMYTE